MSSTARRAGALAVVTFVAATASACSTSNSLAHDVELPAKNRAQWVMPLDQYIAPAWDPLVYGTRVLAKQCMDKTQYEWPLAAETIDPPTGPSWNNVHRKLFNVALARTYGYGNSPEFQVSETERKNIDEAFRAAADLTPGAQAALDECWNDALQQLKVTTDPTSYAQELQTTGERSRADRHRTAQLAERWRTCMRPAGVADLPEDPNDMSPSVFLSGEELPAPTDGGARTPSTREREVAVQDAECQESTGWQQAEYTAEWNQQAAQIRKHADTLERNQAEAERQRDRAMQIIAEFAPRR